MGQQAEMIQRNGSASRNYWHWTGENEKKWGPFKRPLGQHKHTNVCILEVPEGEERKKGVENMFEDSSWTLP